MGVYDAYVASRAGQSKTISFSAGDATDAAQIVKTKTPVLVILRATKDVRLRQGGSSAEADATSFLLYANTYWPMLIEGDHDSYLSAWGDSEAGDLICTIANSTALAPVA